MNILYLKFHKCQGQMSYNVTDIRRFASPDKDLRSKARTGKMWV